MQPRVYPGAIEALSLSRHLGKKIILITSGMRMELERNTAALAEKARSLGYRTGMWDATVCYEEIRQEGGKDLGKPHTRSMELGLEKADLEKDFSRHRLAYIGDSKGDMLFACNLSATGVLLETTTRIGDIRAHLGDFMPLVFRDMHDFYETLCGYARRKP